MLLRTNRRVFRLRIGISGSHFVGKSSLAEALASALPDYELVPEPYHLMEQAGHVFAELPALDDFALQLDRSIAYIHHSVPNIVFDRCPLDFLGYLQTHADAGQFEFEDWLPRIRDAVAKLDLIVFVPIETPDRLAVARSHVATRAEVDAVLRDVIARDCYGIGANVVEVTGSLDARLQSALAKVH